jgi:sec1 family domain-containing protein 1
MEEYGNLQEWVARTGGTQLGGGGGAAAAPSGAGDRARRRVVYGSTELVNAADFVRDELERLGREVAS